MNSKIEQQLQLLRVRWKNEPENRKTIELQAKILKMSEPKFREPARIEEDPRVLEVMDALL